MQTLLLDTVTWDLVVDAAGNIAVASNPYSQAQDAASACRLFSAELWYNTAAGIPYFTQILGKSPPISLMKQVYVDAALTVPDVVKARVFLNGLVDRRVTGQVQIVNTDGQTQTAGF